MKQLFLTIWNRCVAFFLPKRQESDTDTREIAEPPKMDSVAPTHLQAQVSPQPGLTCPRCSFKIQINISHLLSGQPIICHACFLQLNLDTQKSAEALAAMRKLQNNLDKAEDMRKG